MNGGSASAAQIDAVAEAICGVTASGRMFPWASLSEADKDGWRRMAEAAVAAMSLEREWGAISAQESEPHQIFNFRESAEKVSASRNEHGMPARVVSRLVGPWVAAETKEQP